MGVAMNNSYVRKSYILESAILISRWYIIKRGLVPK